jgi:nicotinamide riboside transporter PnuC
MRYDTLVLPQYTISDHNFLFFLFFMNKNFYSPNNQELHTKKKNWFKHYKWQEMNRISKALQIKQAKTETTSAKHHTTQ